MSDVSVFLANDGADGIQLWRTDGTAGGTFALTSFASNNGALSTITSVGGIAYFEAPDGANQFGTQYQLWRSDGTASGTYALGLSGENNADSGPHVAQIGDVVYYFGRDATHGVSLFASTDGQPGQFVTQLLGPNDIQPIDSMLAVGSDLLFQIGAEVFVSDGTSAGTHQATDFQGLGLDSNTAPFVAGGQTYLLASANGDQGLYRDDGTTLTKVGLPNPNAVGSLVAVGSHFVFVTQTFSGTFFESWDGSSQNVVQLVATGSPGPEYAVQDGELYFGVSDPSSAQAPTSAVYETDGTTAGTREVAAGDYTNVVPVGSNLILAGPAGSGPFAGTNVWVSNGTVGGATEVVTAGGGVDSFVRVGAEVFFRVNSNQLWVSDGTVAGTHLVRSFSTLSSFSADGSQLLFSAAALGSNTEPWISDGTGAGTHLIANVAPPGPGALSVTAESGLGGDLVFIGQTGSETELWVSDGSPEGTTPVSVIGGLLALSPPIVAAGGKVYLNSSFGGGLWVYSGAGIAGPIASDLDFQASPTFLTAFDGELVFYGANAGPQVTARFGGGGLFITDGTDAGTSLITGDTVLTQPAALGAELLFLGSSSANGAGLFETDGTAAGTQFVASVPTAFATGSFTVSGSEAFFVTGDAATGAELWVTNATAAGTHLVEDIAPGALGSNPGQLTPFDGGVVFTADDSQHGQQVWFSNGTAAGTLQLDINQTRDPSASLSVSDAFALNGKTYVLASDGVHGVQLLATDGTTAGTSVAALLSTADVGPDIADIQPLNGGVFFTHQSEPWVTDGTSAGTFQIPGDFTSIGSPVVVGDSVFFQASPPDSPFTDLFVSNGSDSPATDIASNVSGLFSGDGDVFYTAPSGGANSFALYAYQPSTNVTTSLASVTAVSVFGPPIAVVVNGGGETQVGSSQGAQESQLWATDGTTGGTQMLAQAPGNSDFSDFTELNGKVYFGSLFSNNVANDGLWVTDGTVAGTREIVGVNVMNGSLEAVGGDLLFLATDSSNRTAGWSYNPSTGVATEGAITAVASLPSDFTVAGSVGYFVADDATSQGELWRVTGANVISELTSPTNGEIGAGQSNAISLAAMGNGLFFSADDSTHGPSLFFTNGSTVTFLAQVENATDFSVIGNLLYFQGADPTNGSELWVSNGTAAGTHRITDTETPGSADASDFTVVGNRMFFSADDGVHGQELWVFNGQAGGATMVADLDPGAAGSSPSDLTALGGDVYFIASNGTGAPELWRSDGTASGTTAITTASNGASPQDLTMDGSELFFFGTDSVHGSGLFVSDGTSGGTSFVHGFSAITAMSVEGGHLYFQGTDSSGSELWTSDGTAAGTTELSSTGADPGSNPTDFTPLGTPIVATQDDFSGDGFSGVLFGQTNGTLAEWQMDGTSIVGGGNIGSPGGTWAEVGTGDFNGDGKADILFQDASGNLATWEMNGTSIIGGGAIGDPGGTWSEKGVGDFNGDGMSDILFQDAGGNLAIWEMNGTQIIGGGAIGNPGGTWTEKAIGDFNGDGKSDILFQDASGNLAIWEMNGTSIVGGGDIGNPGPGWSVEGTGDFNGDGTSDVLFQNASTGDYAIWEMNGTTIIGGGDIGNPGPNWSFAGIGDYDGDGHADILFTDAAGDLAIWEMNGTQIIGGGQIGNPGAVWHVLG